MNKPMEWEEEFEEKFEDSYGWNPSGVGTKLENEIKAFISHQISSARADERKRIVEVVKGTRLTRETAPYWVDDVGAYNHALTDILSILKETDGG